MRPRAFAAQAALIAAGLACTAAGACELPGGGAQTINGPRYAIAYRSDPAQITVGRHFALEFRVCPKAGVPAPESLRVDAWMPDHRHGMNYRPVIKLGATPGVQRAEGLMFHMPGRWEFVFELQADGSVERLAQSRSLR